MRKIILFINSLHVGGAEQQLLRLAETLLKKNYVVNIITLETGGSLVDRARELGCSPLFLCRPTRFAMLRILSVLLSVWRLRVVLKKIRKHSQKKSSFIAF